MANEDDLIRRFSRTDLNDNTPPPHTDRSTWAEVVSGNNEEGNYEEKGRRIGTYSGRNEEGNYEEKGSRISTYNVGGSQKKNRHDWQEEKRHQEVAADSDGWETAGAGHRRPPNKYHKVPNEQSQSYRSHPSEQVYADEIGDDIDIKPTQKELSDLSKACSKLWELDLSRLVPGQDYEIDCGEGKKPWQEGDMAQNSLFCWVSEDVFRRPTYARFCDLLDNYNPNQRASELVTSDEKHEETAFVEEISRTAPIKYLHKYLVAKGLVPYHYEGFKRKMKSLWFDLFDRSGTCDSSSAFEHVFVGEVKQRQTKEVSGFHNWIAFYLEEAKGRIDYQGYIFPRRRGQIPASQTQLLTIQFTWNGVLKSLSSTLIGVSPEFEIALYTLCFYGGEQDNYIELGPYNVNMRCYRLEGDKIGSAFPIAEN